MKYVAARQIMWGYLYFQNNHNDSPKWTTDLNRAMVFDTIEDALTKSDRTRVYGKSIIAMEVNE